LEFCFKFRHPNARTKCATITEQQCLEFMHRNEWAKAQRQMVACPVSKVVV
jgi:hypothetical protein